MQLPDSSRSPHGSSEGQQPEKRGLPESPLRRENDYYLPLCRRENYLPLDSVACAVLHLTARETDEQSRKQHGCLTFTSRSNFLKAASPRRFINR